MADTYDFALTIWKNNQRLSGFDPIVRRITCDESQGFTYEKATGGGYVAVPSNQLDTIQALLLTADQALTVRLDGQTDAGIVLGAGGLLLIVNATIDAAAATNVTIDNSSGSTANVKGLAAGT